MSTTQPTRTDDLVEIQQTLARYAVTITQGDIDGLIGVFTPDGTYSAFGDTYTLDRFPELVGAAPKGLFMTGTTQPADFDGPAVPHPIGVIQRPADPGELLHMALQRVVGPGGQVILVEPRAQPGPELLDIHGVGRPMACGRPESCTPLRRMNVMARVLSRQPSGVRE